MDTMPTIGLSTYGIIRRGICFQMTSTDRIAIPK